MNLKYTVLARNNNNKIISSSDDKFAGIGAGSLIKIGEDPVLHTIVAKESLFFIKDFSSTNPKIIAIENDDYTPLQNGDSIKITFKEYEAKFVMSIINGGIGYSNGDILTTKGGVISFDASIGSGQPCELEVVDVDSNGKALAVIIRNSGKYISFPENPVEFYSKRGHDAKIELKYIETSNRSLLERTIENIYIADNKNFIVLDYSIPQNINSGKISTEKNILILSDNYNGNTSKNIAYQIYRDFTPNIKLPLLVKGSLSVDIVYNKMCMILDAEISKIKESLKIS